PSEAREKKAKDANPRCWESVHRVFCAVKQRRFGECAATERLFFPNLNRAGQGSPDSFSFRGANRMSTPLWSRWLRRIFSSAHLSDKNKPSRRQLGHMRLDELEARLAPALFSVHPQLQITCLDDHGDSAAHAVLFFESEVADTQVLRQGLDAGTDAVLLD